MYNLPPPPHAALGAYPSPLLQGGTKGEEKGGFPRKRCIVYTFAIIHDSTDFRHKRHIFLSKYLFTYILTVLSLLCIICAVFTQLYPRMYR